MKKITLFALIVTTVLGFLPVKTEASYQSQAITNGLFQAAAQVAARNAYLSNTTPYRYQPYGSFGFTQPNVCTCSTQPQNYPFSGGYPYNNGYGSPYGSNYGYNSGYGYPYGSTYGYSGNYGMSAYPFVYSVYSPLTNRIVYNYRYDNSNRFSNNSNLQTQNISTNYLKTNIDNSIGDTPVDLNGTNTPTSYGREGTFTFDAPVGYGTESTFAEPTNSSYGQEGAFTFDSNAGYGQESTFNETTAPSYGQEGTFSFDNANGYANESSFQMSNAGYGSEQTFQFDNGAYGSEDTFSQ